MSGLIVPSKTRRKPNELTLSTHKPDRITVDQMGWRVDTIEAISVQIKKSGSSFRFAQSFWVNCSDIVVSVFVFWQIA
jgi:hypothetical protein